MPVSSEKVIEFINHFTFNGKYKQVIESFTCGNCYWFAFILKERFAVHDAYIVYDDIANHFGCYIDGRVYDITGNITDDYVWTDWDVMYDIDPVHYKRIVRDCVLQVKPEEYE